MRHSRSLHTADGSTVTVQPRGVEYDLHVQDPTGRTVVTVEMSADDLQALVNKAEEVLTW
ncbi:hypothetical protein AB0A77_02040 [Streptomyces varsoviensis]|uniref:hypothetical protein n=1 Tax=Streptomyces varsoviensis TaxID=67373 RepID=UPI0033F532AF